jgi:hypothetical protein
LLSIPSHPCPAPGRETWRRRGRAHRTPPLSPSEPDRLDPSHRARTRLQHAAARSTRQSRPLFTLLPARAVSWPPLDTAGAPSPVYKKPPFFPEKIHAITRNLLDNVSLSPVPYVELADLDIPADHRPFPALRSLPRRAACWRWPRRTSGAALHPRRLFPPPPVSSPSAALLPVALAVYSSSWGRRPPPYRFGYNALTGGPLRSGHIFFSSAPGTS